MIAAVDIADLLVRGGVPFREAHGVVAGLVRVGGRRAARALGLSDAELARCAPALDPAALRALLRERSWLESKVSAGGTALARVREQLAAARAALARR